MGKNHGKATKIAHEQAATKPEVKRSIEQMAEGFYGWTRAERKKHINSLLSNEGISIRSLARETGIKESTIRYYRDGSLQVKSTAVPAKQAPGVKAPTIRTVVSHQPQILQTVPRRKTAPKGAVVLPSRPEPPAQRTRLSELAEFILEFLGTRGSQLGLAKHSDIRDVLMNGRSLSAELPDLPKSNLARIPVGQERSDLINKTSVGSYGDDRHFRLELGLRNVVRQLGVGKSELDEALTELKKFLDRHDPDQQGQSASEPGQQLRIAQIRYSPGWRVRMLRQ